MAFHAAPYGVCRALDSVPGIPWRFQYITLKILCRCAGWLRIRRIRHTRSVPSAIRRHFDRVSHSLTSGLQRVPQSANKTVLYVRMFPQEIARKETYPPVTFPAVFTVPPMIFPAAEMRLDLSCWRCSSDLFDMMGVSPNLDLNQCSVNRVFDVRYRYIFESRVLRLYDNPSFTISCISAWG
jgi:hypothetical protein